MAITDPASGASGLNFLNRNVGYFPDPFDDLASQSMPKTLPDALRWAQSVFMIDGTYSRGMRRVASYFITDVEIKPKNKAGKRKLTSEEKDKWNEFLRKSLKIKRVLHRAALDYLVTGVNFISVLMSFRRYLGCPACKKARRLTEFPLATVHDTPEFKFQWTNFEFHATCPVCHYSGAWYCNDRPGGAESEIVVKQWSPHEIEIIYDPIRESRAFIWKIPEKDRKRIRAGELYMLERADKEVIQAVKNGNHIMFDPGAIHYTWDQGLSGIDSAGWGVSQTVSHFRLEWRHQVLQRMNEAIAQDYIIPFRVITPEPKQGADAASADPVFGGSLGRFNAQIQAMLRARRKDPARWNVLPFPVKYQAMGGEAAQLAPFQLIDQARDDLLNASGVPAELYKGTLSVQAAPAALRLFESQHQGLVDALDEIVEYVVDRSAELLNWEPVDARQVKVTHADDLNRQMAKLQLMMGGQLSQTTAMQSIGADFKQEQDNIADEQEYVQEKQMELQELIQGKADMAMMAQPGQDVSGQGGGGGAPGGAAPAMGGGGVGVGSSGQMSVQELDAKAQEIAQQIAGMPDSQKQSELINLKKQDGTLHALVSQYIDGFRQQAQTAGGAQVMAQQFGKQGSQAPCDVYAPSALAAWAVIRGQHAV